MVDTKIITAAGNTHQRLLKLLGIEKQEYWCSLKVFSQDICYEEKNNKCTEKWSSNQS